MSEEPQKRSAPPPELPVTDPPAPARRPRRPRPATVGWFVVALVAYGLYILARELAPGGGEPTANAASILDAERWLGIHVEGDVHGVFAAPVPTAVLGALYIAAQFLVVPATLLVLWRRAPATFHALRGALLASWVVGAAIAAALPVAPPRIADPEVVSTLGDRASGLLDAPLVTALYNPLAAVPSMHVAFAVAVGCAWASVAPSRRGRAIALAWPLVVSFVVIATGNHYVLDVVAGVATIAIGHAVWISATALARAARRVELPAGLPRPALPHRRRTAPAGERT